MRICIRNPEPDPQLFYPLVEGEERITVRREDAVITAALARARGECRGLVVLVHGAASNASRWEEFTEKTALREHWDVLRFDLRGHGASPTRTPATLERHAGDIEALLRAAGHERAVILGHSLGAAIAMRFADEHREAVKGLVLLDPLLSGCLTEKAIRMRRKRWMPVTLEIIGRFTRALGIERRLPFHSLRKGDEAARLKIAEGGEALEAFVKEYSSPWRDLVHIHLADYARDLLEVGRPTPDLSPLRVPVLVIGASSGSFTSPERMREKVAGLAAGEFTLLECRHWPVTECLGDLMHVVEDWAERRLGA
ncbi:alpha/beta fold hydrolase [Sutterella sp.]|uniref:alpha/beta fold hydrolase n=1 Tax=Sutterella sp. TaxID=1981025 RepID=UPI0026DFFC58|nr:alpha/beta hydrolase [Sutterella sp.]MDO5530481.1 alpha/beta hydrolase [Sutterella sp.]